MAMQAPTSPQRLRHLAGCLRDLLLGLAEEHEQLRARTARLAAENTELGQGSGDPVTAARLDGDVELTPAPCSSLLRVPASWTPWPMLADAAASHEATCSDSLGGGEFKDARSQADTCSLRSFDAELGHRSLMDHKAECGGPEPSEGLASGVCAFVPLHEDSPGVNSECSARSVVSFACHTPDAAEPGDVQAAHEQRSPRSCSPQGRLHLPPGTRNCRAASAAEGFESRPGHHRAMDSAAHHGAPPLLCHSPAAASAGAARQHLGMDLSEIDVSLPWPQACGSESQRELAHGVEDSKKPGLRPGEPDAGAPSPAWRRRPLESEVPVPSSSLMTRSSVWEEQQSSTHASAGALEARVAGARFYPQSGLRLPRVRAPEAELSGAQTSGRSPSHESSRSRRGAFVRSDGSPRQTARCVWPKWKTPLEEVAGPLSPTSWRRHGLDLKKKGGRALLRRIVVNPYFDIVSGVLIISNIIFMGVQAHMTTVAEFNHFRGQGTGQDWLTFELAFFICFLVELVMRFIGLGFDFLRGPDRSWHLLEVMLVVVSIPEFTGVTDSFNVSFLRAVRLIRIVRIVQLAGDSNLIDSLRTMMQSLSKSMYCFSPVVVMLGAVLYIFAVMFMQAVSAYLVKAQVTAQEETTRLTVAAMDKYYGSLGRTLLTLFMCISGGDSWVYAAEPLMQIGPFTQVLFLAYIAFVLFALLNILNGLFVDAAVQSASAKRKLAVDAAIEDMSQMAREITNMFAEADGDGNGYMSKEELLAYTQNDRTRACFQSLELDVASLVRLFDEIDTAASGEVELAEFVKQCIELRGAAKKVDLSLMESHIYKQLLRIENAVSQPREPPSRPSVSCRGAGEHP
mmetsp:Transcript_71966/g.227492  ORF Transcript_71966/g.227492 Transcript_71966/m.227492 type:complete len:852 (-) Transcript_71966:110-2665(-)